MELKPCPFCGGEPTLSCYRNFLVKCFGSQCSADVESWGKTEEEAVEKWNTRAERTCRGVWHDADPCELVGHWACSACGESQAFTPSHNYCPNCGAKVDMADEMGLAK